MKKFLICFFLLIPTLSFAETITLKSGKVLEGEIVEKTQNYIRIDCGWDVFKIKYRQMDEGSQERLLGKDAVEFQKSMPSAVNVGRDDSVSHGIVSLGEPSDFETKVYNLVLKHLKNEKECASGRVTVDKLLVLSIGKQEAVRVGNKSFSGQPVYASFKVTCHEGNNRYSWVGDGDAPVVWIRKGRSGYETFLPFEKEFRKFAKEMEKEVDIMTKKMMSQVEQQSRDNIRKDYERVDFSDGINSREANAIARHQCLKESTCLQRFNYRFSDTFDELSLDSAERHLFKEEAEAHPDQWIVLFQDSKDDEVTLSRIGVVYVDRKTGETGDFKLVSKWDVSDGISAGEALFKAQEFFKSSRRFKEPSLRGLRPLLPQDFYNDSIKQFCMQIQEKHPKEWVITIGAGSYSAKPSTPLGLCYINRETGKIRHSQILHLPSFLFFEAAPDKDTAPEIQHQQQGRENENEKHLLISDAFDEEKWSNSPIVLEDKAGDVVPFSDDHRTREFDIKSIKFLQDKATLFILFEFADNLADYFNSEHPCSEEVGRIFFDTDNNVETGGKDTRSDEKGYENMLVLQPGIISKNELTLEEVDGDLVIPEVGEEYYVSYYMWNASGKSSWTRSQKIVRSYKDPKSITFKGKFLEIAVPLEDLKVSPDDVGNIAVIFSETGANANKWDKNDTFTDKIRLK